MSDNLTRNLLNNVVNEGVDEAERLIRAKLGSEYLLYLDRIESIYHRVQSLNYRYNSIAQLPAHSERLLEGFTKKITDFLSAEEREVANIFQQVEDRFSLILNELEGVDVAELIDDEIISETVESVQASSQKIIGTLNFDFSSTLSEMDESSVRVFLDDVSEVFSQAEELLDTELVNTKNAIDQGVNNLMAMGDGLDEKAATYLEDVVANIQDQLLQPVYRIEETVRAVEKTTESLESLVASATESYKTLQKVLVEGVETTDVSIGSVIDVLDFISDELRDALN